MIPVEYMCYPALLIVAGILLMIAAARIVRR
jgi:hypothetical protein